MKLVQAKFREVEHMPDWVKCCPARIQELAELGLLPKFHVNPDSGRDSWNGEYHCTHCGEKRPSKKRLDTNEPGTSVFAEMIWIDEGPVI